MKTYFYSLKQKATPAGIGHMNLTIKLMFFVTLFNLIPSMIYAQDAEEDALKAIIKSETMGFYGRNADVWQSAWLQDAKATRTIVANNNYGAVTGWENFGPDVVKNIKENPKPIPVEIANDNFLIHTDGTMAWVEYDQTLTAPSIDPAIKRLSREHRALVKKDGQWKIFSQITHDPETFGSTPEAIEANLNMNGYHLLSAKKIKEAIEVFKLNVQLHPQSWNSYDSLGEAYAADGNKKLAIRNYEKSLELNPKNETGKAALAKLKQTETKSRTALTKVQ
jgi:tetratricopeptide (TPR) repeat protein